jgi:hypothetical protein
MMPRTARSRIDDEDDRRVGHERLVSRKSVSKEQLDDVERKFLEPVARYLAILQEWFSERPFDGSGTVPNSKKP